MTAQRDPDVILASWLDEGPTDLPNATRRAILISLPTTPQVRRGPFAPWRLSTTKGFGPLAAAAIVAVLAIGGATYVLPRLGVGAPGPSPSASPSAPSPTTAPTVAVTPVPLPSGVAALREGPLAAGSYSTTQYQPTLRFTLGDGWSAQFQDDSDEISLLRGNGDFLAITRVTRVVDPTTFLPVPVPDDLMAWLAANPNFEWSGPNVRVEIAGLTGRMIEGRVIDGIDPTGVFAYDTGNMRVISRDRMRYYVLPLDGPDLTIVLAVRDDARFITTMEAVQPLLDSLEIGAP